MEIGIGLEQGLRLSFAQSSELVRDAARLGYRGAWSPGRLGQDAFLTCAAWSSASSSIVDGGITTGISVVSAGLWTVPSLASLAATLGAMSGGRFILGVGSGGIYNAAYRHTFGLPNYPIVGRMRDFVTALRSLLSGERVEYEGGTLALHGAQLSFQPPVVPVFLGALGPQMLRLAGEVADGAALNYCTPAARRESRRLVEGGATASNRDPAALRLAEYIRMSVDDDPAKARRALGREVLGYAMVRAGARKDRAYRGHFARMGFGDILEELEAARDKGASIDQLVDSTPDELLLGVGYYGRAEGAAAALERLAEGLDFAIVRVVPARPGIESIRSVMTACRPAAGRA